MVLQEHGGSKHGAGGGSSKPFPVRAVTQGSWVWLWGCRGPSQGMKIEV